MMQVQRKAYLLHVTGRSSVGGVSVEGWWSPIYQLDLPLSAVQRWPAGGPTLPDRGAKTDEELRRRNLGRGLLISIVTALLAWDVKYAHTASATSFLKILQSRFLLKILFTCFLTFCNLNFSRVNQQFRQIQKVRRVCCS